MFSEVNGERTGRRRFDKRSKQNDRESSTILAIFLCESRQTPLTNPDSHKHLVAVNMKVCDLFDTTSSANIKKNNSPESTGDGPELNGYETRNFNAVRNGPKQKKRRNRGFTLLYATGESPTFTPFVSFFMDSMQMTYKNALYQGIRKNPDFLKHAFTYQWPQSFNEQKCPLSRPLQAHRQSWSITPVYNLTKNHALNNRKNASEKRTDTTAIEQFEHACNLYQGIECWNARELQTIFSYTEWRNFLNVVDKAKEACQHSGNEVSDHFVDVNKMIEVGKGGQREVDETGRRKNETRHVAVTVKQQKNQEY
jgi:hypothetical protein